MQKEQLLTPTLRWFLAAMILANVSSQMMFTLLAVFLTQLGAGVAQVGLVFSAASVVPLALQILGGWLSDSIGWLASLRGAAMIPATLAAGWLIDRYREHRLITVGFLTQCAGWAALVRATDAWGFAVSAVLLGLGFGAMIPAYDSLISKAVPEKMRGIAFGLFGTSISLLSLPAPWLGAQLWEIIDPRLPFALTGAVALACGFAAWSRLQLKAMQPADAIVIESFSQNS